MFLGIDCRFLVGLGLRERTSGWQNYSAGSSGIGIQWVYPVYAVWPPWLTHQPHSCLAIWQYAGFPISISVPSLGAVSIGCQPDIPDNEDSRPVLSSAVSWSSILSIFFLSSVFIVFASEFGVRKKWLGPLFARSPRIVVSRVHRRGLRLLR
jgi:hypothetical protein